MSDGYGTSTAYSGNNGTIVTGTAFNVSTPLEVARPGLLYGIELQVEAPAPSGGSVPSAPCTANLTVYDNIEGYYTDITYMLLSWTWTGQGASTWRYIPLPGGPISVQHSYFMGVYLTCGPDRPFQATVYGPGPVKRPQDGQVALRFGLYTAGSVMEAGK